VNKVAQLNEHAKSLEKELARLKSKLASSQGDDLTTQATEINGVKVLAAMLDGADANALRETMDKLKDKLKTAAIVLASVNEGKVSLVAGVTADLIAKIKAGDLVNHVARKWVAKAAASQIWQWQAAPMQVAYLKHWQVLKAGSVIN
jgi:alanyl-tRNA synthetase